MVSVLRLFVVFMGVLVFSPDLFAFFCGLELKENNWERPNPAYYVNKNPVRHILEGGSEVYPPGTICVLLTAVKDAYDDYDDKTYAAPGVLTSVRFKENKGGEGCNGKIWGLKQESHHCNKVLTAFGGHSAPKFLKDYEIDTGKYYPPPPPEEPKQETACANAVDKCSCSCESTGHNVGLSWFTTYETHRRSA